MSELNTIKKILSIWKENILPERKEKVIAMIEKGIQLIGTEYHLGGTLTEGEKRGIDCSHFAAYALGLPNRERENTWTLDAKYKENEVVIEDATPGDLLMWPWHYDPDVKREIGHVEIIIGRANNGDFLTLGASGLSRQGSKYNAHAEKLQHHNCVGFSLRKWEDGMRILRAE